MASQSTPVSAHKITSTIKATIVSPLPATAATMEDMMVRKPSSLLGEVEVENPLGCWERDHQPLLMKVEYLRLPRL